MHTHICMRTHRHSRMCMHAGRMLSHLLSSSHTYGVLQPRMWPSVGMLARTHARMHARTHTTTNTHTHIYKHTHTHTHIHTHIYKHTHTHTHTHKRARARTRANPHTCTHWKVELAHTRQLEPRMLEEEVVREGRDWANCKGRGCRWLMDATPVLGRTPLSLSS